MILSKVQNVILSEVKKVLPSFLPKKFFRITCLLIRMQTILFFLKTLRTLAQLPRGPRR